MLRWVGCGIYKKCTGTHDAELVFLHLVGSVGHVVHSGASGVRNSDALLFMLGWDRHRFDKNAPGRVMPYFCFSIWWGMRVT
jgi:hypothetical protein